MRLFKFSRRVCWLSVLLIAMPVVAGELKQLTLDERVAASELVMFGKVRQVVKNTSGFGSDIAVITPETVLKGQAAADIKFAFNGSIAESHSDCCVVGNRYLLFMGRNKDGEYFSVNGRHGVYLLPTRH